VSDEEGAGALRGMYVTGRGNRLPLTPGRGTGTRGNGVIFRLVRTRCAERGVMPVEIVRVGLAADGATGVGLRLFVGAVGVGDAGPGDGLAIVRRATRGRRLSGVGEMAGRTVVRDLGAGEGEDWARVVDLYVGIANVGYLGLCAVGLPG